MTSTEEYEIDSVGVSLSNIRPRNNQTTWYIVTAETIVHNSFITHLSTIDISIEWGSLLKILPSTLQMFFVSCEYTTH